MAPAFAVLAAWSRRDDVESRGSVLFREFWERIHDNRAIWRIPFSTRRPLTTPGGLNVRKPKVARLLLIALADTVKAIQEKGYSLEVSLGETQRLSTSQGDIPIPGGQGIAGVLNLMHFGPLTQSGYAQDAIQGTTYTQVVTWENGEVIAEAILPISQSSDPRSPHAWDQTTLFAAKQWIRLPFDEQSIGADPNLRSVRISSCVMVNPHTF